jgi:hypothetical protein
MSSSGLELSDAQSAVESMTVEELDAAIAAVEVQREQAMEEQLSPQWRQLESQLVSLWEARAELSDGDLPWLLRHFEASRTAHRKVMAWLSSLAAEFRGLTIHYVLRGPAGDGAALMVCVALEKGPDVSHLPAALDVVWAELCKAFPHAAHERCFSVLDVERGLSADVVVEGDRARLSVSGRRALSGSLVGVLQYVASYNGALA